MRGGVRKIAIEGKTRRAGKTTGRRKEKEAVREKVEKEENYRKLCRPADEEAIFPVSF